MRSQSLLFALLSACGALALEAKDIVRNDKAFVPGGYIVELSSPTSKRSLSPHDDFLNALDKRAGGKFETRKKYDSPVFTGIAVQLHTPEELVDLASMPNVVAVRPIIVHAAPKPVQAHVVSGPNDPALIPDGQSTHVMTGVDKAHAQGFTGKGIKIGVLDTGIDYTHPSLGGGFGPGHKIAGGYDLVGDDYDGFNTPVPDNDPFDSCTDTTDSEHGHGTHVAGIIAADPGNEFNISGVAYGAEIHGYRVFGCAIHGSVSEDVLISAMIKAYEDGMDIITISIGVPSGWASTSIAVVAGRIAGNGRVITIAAGNAGEAGTLFSSAPATGKDVIAVASVENTLVTRQTMVSSVSHAPIPYTLASWPNITPGQPQPLPETPFPVWAPTTDPKSNDAACQPLGDDVPDLSNSVVLLRQATECSDIDQYLNIQAKGGKLVLLYASDEDILYGFFTAVKLVNAEDGEFLVSEFAKGSNITVTFPQHNGAVGVPNPETGGLVSDFSAFGPSNEVYFKPTISAPGGNITSTWPTLMGSWAILSGTSMATPFAAGSAALVLEAKGKRALRNVRGILETTSLGIPSSKAAGALPQTLAQQGTGIVNLFNALNVKTEVSPAELLLNDTANWKSTHKVTIKNTGKAKQTYKLRHQAAATAISLRSGDVSYNLYPVPLVDAPANVRLSKTSVTLAPGASTTISVTISPPKKVDPKTLPVVSGWIHVAGSRGDNVKVSYMGIAGSLRAAQVISTGNDLLVPKDGGLPAVIPLDYGELRSQRGPRNYTLDMLPIFGFSLAQGTRSVVLDLVRADTKIKSNIPNPLDAAPLTPSKRGWSWWWPGLFKPGHGHGGGNSFADVPTLGPLNAAEYVARSGFARQAPVPYFAFDFPTTFANGTAIPFGQYRLLLRALRITGDAKNAKDYDVYVSEQVGLVESLESQ